jgi:hypothetical protein
MVPGGFGGGTLTGGAEFAGRAGGVIEGEPLVPDDGLDTGGGAFLSVRGSALGLTGVGATPFIVGGGGGGVTIAVARGAKAALSLEPLPDRSLNRTEFGPNLMTSPL